MRRYVSLTPDEFGPRHHELCPWVANMDPDESFAHYVFLYDEDGRATRFVGQDGGEPEDLTLDRNFDWVVDELNDAVKRGDEPFGKQVSPNVWLDSTRFSLTMRVVLRNQLSYNEVNGIVAEASRELRNVLLNMEPQWNNPAIRLDLGGATVTYNNVTTRASSVRLNP